MTTFLPSLPSSSAMLLFAVLMTILFLYSAWSEKKAIANAKAKYPH